jgi:hypothetical protein
VERWRGLRRLGVLSQLQEASAASGWEGGGVGLPRPKRRWWRGAGRVAARAVEDAAAASSERLGGDRPGDEWLVRRLGERS